MNKLYIISIAIVGAISVFECMAQKVVEGGAHSSVVDSALVEEGNLILLSQKVMSASEYYKTGRSPLYKSSEELSWLSITAINADATQQVSLSSEELKDLNPSQVKSIVFEFINHKAGSYQERMQATMCLVLRDKMIGDRSDFQIKDQTDPEIDFKKISYLSGDIKYNYDSYRQLLEQGYRVDRGDLSIFALKVIEALSIYVEGESALPINQAPIVVVYDYETGEQLRLSQTELSQVMIKAVKSIEFKYRSPKIGSSFRVDNCLMIVYL